MIKNIKKMIETKSEDDLMALNCDNDTFHNSVLPLILNSFMQDAVTPFSRVLHKGVLPINKKEVVILQDKK